MSKITEKDLDKILNNYSFLPQDRHLEMLKAELIAWNKRICLDVIGEDEMGTTTTKGVTTVRIFNENRNELRADQRSKLSAGAVQTRPIPTKKGE